MSERDPEGDYLQYLAETEGAKQAAEEEAWDQFLSDESMDQLDAEIPSPEGER